MGEVEIVSKALSAVGNGGALAGAFLLWKMFSRFEIILERQAHELRAVRDALIAANPYAAEIFHKADENALRVENRGPDG